MRYTRLLKSAAIALLATLALSAQATERLRMSTTTSTDHSGLLKVLNPPFEQKDGVKIDVIAVGTGKALKLGENGDVDIVFVHAPEAEKRFVEAGFGTDRAPVMHNDFVIVGPPSDPAGIGGSESASEAFRKIADSGETFISRGDESGTHKKEKSIWETTDIEPGGSWYLAIGQGMGEVLQVAYDREAYALADRGTFIAYEDNIDLEVLVEGDEILFNPYHIIAVNPERHPHARIDLARKYIEFITGEEGQRIIKEFTINNKQLFYPDAMPD